MKWEVQLQGAPGSPLAPPAPWQWNCGSWQCDMDVHCCRLFHFQQDSGSISNPSEALRCCNRIESPLHGPCQGFHPAWLPSVVTRFLLTPPEQWCHPVSVCWAMMSCPSQRLRPLLWAMTRGPSFRAPCASLPHSTEHSMWSQGMYSSCFHPPSTGPTLREKIQRNTQGQREHRELTPGQFAALDSTALGGLHTFSGEHYNAITIMHQFKNVGK